MSYVFTVVPSESESDYNPGAVLLASHDADLSEACLAILEATESNSADVFICFE